MSVDLEKMILWNNFKEAVMLSISDRASFEVDLAFEFKDSKGHIVTLTSGNQIYINDLKLSAKPDLCFEVPTGSINRYIPLSYAENISHAELGELDQFVESIYHDVYSQFEGASNYPKGLKAFIQSIKSHEVNDFNNSATWIKEKIQAVIDEKSFGSMDEFGMF